MFWLGVPKLKLTLLGNWQAGLKQGLGKTFLACADRLRQTSGGEVDIYWR